MPNLLYYGDNLEVLRLHVKDESVDLVYLDPPFNSNATYNALFSEHGTKAAAQIKAFEDTWTWDEVAAKALWDTVKETGGQVAEALLAFQKLLPDSDMLAYLAMMAPRLVEMRRALKPTGSLYLHCDPTASHYLKVLLDATFEPPNFRNEITWKRTNARSTDQRWPRIHDTLLFCSKGASFKFKPTVVPADKAKLPHTLITGPDGQKYQTFELTGAGVTKEGDSGKPWRGFDPSAFGRHWAISPSTLDELDAGGLIHWPKPGTAGGFPRRRAEEPFDEEARTITVGDVWTDIDRINQAAKERLGYPTQKPEALLERIIRASSDEGDLVLDPFCGCGTTVAVAQRLKRRWVGIDITHLAINLIRHRLYNAYGESVASTYKVVGEPTTLEDAAELAATEPMQFQWWALGLVGARPAASEQKKGADKGADGRIYFQDEPTGPPKRIILSVKAGNTGSGHVDQLRGVVDKEDAALGVLISFQEPTKPMRENAASAGFYTSPTWNTSYPRIQLLTVRELLDGEEIAYPHVTGTTFKKAPKAEDAAPDEPLPFEPTE